MLPEEALGDINIHFRDSVCSNVSNKGKSEKFHFYTLIQVWKLIWESSRPQKLSKYLFRVD